MVRIEFNGSSVDVDKHTFGELINCALTVVLDYSSDLSDPKEHPACIELLNLLGYIPCSGGYCPTYKVGDVVLYGDVAYAVEHDYGNHVYRIGRGADFVDMVHAKQLYPT